MILVIIFSAFTLHSFTHVVINKSVRPREIEKSIIDKNCVTLSREFAWRTRLVKLNEEWKARNCVPLRDSRFSLHFEGRGPKWFPRVRVWARENAREKTFWASYMNPSTDRVFGANFTGIVRKYWIIDATLMRCLTAFKTENPDARKKTKLNHRGLSFFISPLVVSHDRFTRHNQVPPGDSSAKSWLAGKLIRSIRCERHVRKHVDNEACNFVSKAGLLALREILSISGRWKPIISCLNKLKLINYINLSPYILYPTIVEY